MISTEPQGDFTPRRFVATIRGWQNFRIFVNDTNYLTMTQRVELIKARVASIRNRIDAGDETVFNKEQAW
jgi:hypothetical protein